jgi:hypothetical protein
LLVDQFLVSDVGSDHFLIPTNGRDKVSARPEFVAEKIPNLAFDILREHDSDDYDYDFVTLDLLEGPRGSEGDPMTSILFSRSRRTASIRSGRAGGLAGDLDGVEH